MQCNSYLFRVVDVVDLSNGHLAHQLLPRLQSHRSTKAAAGQRMQQDSNRAINEQACLRSLQWKQTPHRRQNTHSGSHVFMCKAWGLAVGKKAKEYKYAFGALGGDTHAHVSYSDRGHHCQCTQNTHLKKSQETMNSLRRKCRA